MKLVTERISAEAFAPYGTLVRAPSDVGRTAFSDALHKRPNAHVTLSAVECAAEDPAAYRHRHEAPSLSSQTFFPLDVTRYVVLVAPHGAVGMPDMLRARAFMVPGDAAITYAADSWHHPMLALDRPASFSFLLWRDGTDADIETDDALRTRSHADFVYESLKDAISDDGIGAGQASPV